MPLPGGLPANADHCFALMPPLIFKHRCSLHRLAPVHPVLVEASHGRTPSSPLTGALRRAPCGASAGPTHECAGGYLGESEGAGALSPACGHRAEGDESRASESDHGSQERVKHAGCPLHDEVLPQDVWLPGLVDSEFRRPLGRSDARRVWRFVFRDSNWLQPASFGHDAGQGGACGLVASLDGALLLVLGRHARHVDDWRDQNVGLRHFWRSDQAALGVHDPVDDRGRAQSVGTGALAVNVPHLKNEWVMGIPRPGVKGGRSPAERTLDPRDREIRWPRAGCGALSHPAMEAKAADVAWR